MSFFDVFKNRETKFTGERKRIDKVLAEKIISDLKNNGRIVDYAECGLLADWECTSFIVFDNDSFCYSVGSGHDNSDWATPALIVYFEDGTNEMYHCFQKQRITFVV